MVDLHREFEGSRFYHEARIDRRTADALVGLVDYPRYDRHPRPML